MADRREQSTADKNGAATTLHDMRDQRDGAFRG
jgi:hypothetical protein